MRMLYAKQLEIAKLWAKETPDIKKLAQHVKKKRQKRR